MILIVDIIYIVMHFRAADQTTEERLDIGSDGMLAKGLTLHT